MCTKWQVTMLSGALALVFSGCTTHQSANPRPVTRETQFPHGGMTVDYSTFRSLGEMRTDLVEPFGEDGHLYVFEKDNIKTAICIQRRGGIGWDTLIIYSFQDSSLLWVPYIFWNTQSRDVRVRFNDSTGIVEVRSGGGAIIFQTNITALKARQVPWGW